MGKSINKVILVGRLGRDPELKYTASGTPFCRFSMATDESWNDKGTGEKTERTEWHNVVIFNENLAKVAEQYVKKGSKLYLEGQLQTRKYTDKNGQERSTTEIVLQRYRGEMTLLDGRGGAASGGEEGGSVSYGGGRSSGGPAAVSSRGGEIDDDIPF